MASTAEQPRFGPSTPSGWVPFRIGLGRLAKMCHNVGTGLYAGVDVRRVWEMEAARGSLRHRAAMATIRERVASGDSIAAAIRGEGRYFPALLKEMVEVGERTGRLDEVFKRLGEHYDNLVRLRSAFLMGIAWPMFELTLGIFVIGLFILILGMIATGPEGPPVTFFGLYGSRGFAIYCSIVGACVAAVTFVILASSNGWLYMDRIIQLLVHVPGLGHGLKTIAMSRLIWSLSLSTDTELEVGRAIELAVRTTQNSHYTSRLPAMLKVIQSGGEMHEAFEAARVYPPDFLDALHAGEVSGQISETMVTLAKAYEDKTKLFYRGMAVAAGVGVFMLVGALIIFMIFSLFAQYLDILNSAGQM